MGRGKGKGGSVMREILLRAWLWSDNHTNDQWISSEKGMIRFWEALFSWGAHKEMCEFTGFHENLDGTGERLWEDDEVECKDAFGNKAIGVIKLIDGCWEVAFDKVTFGKGCREYLKCFIANYAIKRLGSIHDKEAV
jgi:hypothetical protein